MNNKKQTAVEWLIEQYGESVNGRCEWEGKWHSLEDTEQKAIEMEKQQHEETFEAGYRDLHGSFEEYYIKTYKNPIQ